jgi:histidine triad (HIT) family protein
MTDCVFCRIANKQLDAMVLYEDEDTVAFLDITPIRRGHCQIIPKEHVETFETLRPDLAGKIMLLGQHLARRIKTVYQLDRVAFLFTGGDVAHAHAHLVPMHEKTDITSARYIVHPENVKFASAHLQADRDTLTAVKNELGLLTL